ncbi:MAG: 4'-phosphopantetheinyl transferase superfamily protein [Chitinophagaceae bacterium]|nr:4'-phosphopantetheinyl transferase superfamily protein [Chitinophagaceae bacterium]
MPLFYQHNINESTKLGVWRIEEPEIFFLQQVSLQREITHPHKRLQHLAGRYLLKFLFPGFPHELIEIAGTRKPYLPNEMYHFSISHCGDYAAAIVSTSRRVGIDIEIPTSKVERVRHKFLHAVEWEGVEKSSLYDAAGERMKKLTLLWSAKEAVFKWYGNGEIDFSEHIRLQTEQLMISGEGIIDASFLKQAPIHLRLPFRLFDRLCLVWVVT